MLYIEWDGLVSYLECWTGALKADPELLTIIDVVEKGLVVFSHLLSYETADPLLLFLQFRCLQTGLVIIDRDPGVFQAFIQKIFSSVGYLGGCSDKYNISRDTVNTRSLITTCFVRLCDAHPSTLAPYVEQLFVEHYLTLTKNDVLVYAEKCNFIESFLILSQKRHGIQEQAAFLGELLQEPKILLQEMESAVSSAQSLVSYLHLDKDPSDSTYQKMNRYKLCFVVHIVSLVLKRSIPVSDQEEAQNHPTYYHILPFLAKFVLPLISSVYQLWSEASKQLLSEHFRNLTQLHHFEKDTILGRTTLRRSENEDFGELGHVQMNLASAHEGCVSCISRSFGVYGSTHLVGLGMVNLSLQAVFGGIENLNLLRLRVLIRHLLIPLVHICSNSEESWKTVLVPFISHACYFIFTKLKNSWEVITHNQGAVTVDQSSRQNGSAESEEILDEQVTILLSREYCHLLENICVKKTYAPRKGKTKLDGEDVLMGEEMPALVVSQPEGSADHWSFVESLTPLGESLLRLPEMCELLFLSSFCGLAWNDSHTSNKCISVAGVLFEKVPTGYFPNEVYEQFFTQVLLALHIHGVRDHVKIQLAFLAMLIYETAVKCCPKLQQIILQVPGAKQEQLQSFNDLLEKDPPVSLKMKKEAFRDLLSGAVGKHIGEVFKRPVTFDLPEMQFKQKKKERSEIDIPDLTALFGDTS